MPALTLTLLGPPHLARADGAAVAPRSRKQLALLIYLAVEQQHPHSRDALLGLLWPDAAEEAARNNLRVALADLRRLLGVAGPALLQASRHSVQFDPASGFHLDVTTFRALLAACRAHTHDDLASCTACLARLEEAAALYCGEFLQGFALPDSSAFEEWVIIQREQLHQQALETFAALALAHERQGDYTAQCRAARRQIELDPWREAAYAQLMRGLWASGQRGAALEQYDMCRRVLSAELGIDPSPELTTLYEQIRSTDAPGVAEVGRGPGATPTLQRNLPAPPPAHNLPTQPTSFVGREEEIAALRQTLSGTRILTLTGVGGCGKTRLALEVAAARVPEYAAGVWLVELASLQDPALVPQAVAEALGLRAPAGRPVTALLATDLREKQLLLVLDNCEHLAPACRQLADQLLRDCPNLCVLATSREVLRVAGEYVWPVAPLSTPDAAVAEPGLLASYDSVRLFVERARAVSAGFELTERNAPAVVQICQRLDSIPLALELAAARVRHMSVETIAARLDDRFGLLTAGSQSSLRQQTLRAALDWSYALLNEPERTCFRRLAVFANGFTLPSAEDVVGPEDLVKCPMLPVDLLARLIDKSLVVVEQRNDGMRYRMLQTVRAYAHDRLAESGEADALRDRHVAHFLALAEQAEPQLFGAEQVDWFDRLATEHANLRVAIDWAVKRADASSALRLVTALWSFWYTRGHYAEGRQRMLEVLALPTAQTHTSTRARALNAAGAMLWSSGDAADARPLLDEALAIGRERGDQWNIGWALLHKGMIAYQEGDYEAAQPLLEDGLASCRAAGGAGRRGVGWGLIFLGDLAIQADDQRQARVCFEESVALLRALSDHALLAYPLRRLGHLVLQGGEFETAAALCTESLRYNLAIEDRLAVAACLAGLAGVAAAQSQQGSVERHAHSLRRAAHLCGAVAARLQAIGAPLWPADAAVFDAAMAAIGARLDEATLRVALAEGSAMTIEQLLVQNEDTPPEHAGTTIEKRSAAPSAPARRWSEMPDVGPLYGRETATEQLEQWLLRDQSRLIAVLGLGGVGKTALVATVARGAAAQFDAVIWRSLLNAPPLDELLRGVLQSLDAASVRALPDSLDGLMHLLLDRLRQERCLLVLDNMESILAAGQAGAYRDGYAPYGQLIQRVGESRHQSCLVLTSREQPKGLERFDANTPMLRVLRLGGIDPAAGRQVLAARGLPAHAADADTLVARYSGNPLALKLVAQAIQELFVGDVSAFLVSEAAIFDDIRAVLDQQCARLSELEWDILLWLAIEREPVTLPELRANLLNNGAPREVVEALRALQRRSLLEQTTRAELPATAAFSLQNVIMEYVSERLVDKVSSEIADERLDQLHRHALLKAQAKEYVRQTQARLLLDPVARQLVSRLGLAGVDGLCRRLLDALRTSGPREPGYAAGNLLNLLTHLQIDLAGYDFSGLSVWQADLREVAALEVSFAGAHFAHAAFSDIFDAVNGVAFSPDGRLVAAGSNNGVVGAWRISDGQRHALFVGHTSSVWSVAFSPEGSLLASASSDATVRLWDVASGESIAVLRGHRNGVATVAFVPGTSLLATGGIDGTLRLWDTRDGHCQQELNGHENGVRALAVNGAGTLLAVCDHTGRVRLWRIADGQCIHTLVHPAAVICVAFRPDGHQLVTGGQDKIARVWDIATGQIIRTLKGHHEHISSTAWSPDGRCVATGSYDTTIQLWDTSSGEQVRVLRGHSDNVYGLAWSGDGAFLVSAGHDETVRVWSAHSGDELRTLRGNAAGVLSVAFSGTSAAFCSTQGRVVREWDVPSRCVRRVLRGHRDVLYTVSYSRDGARIASAGHDCTVRLWDAASGRVLHVLAGHTNVIHTLAFSPDGALLASGSDDASLRLWDVRSGQLVRNFNDHTHLVRAVMFSPDGALLFSGGIDQTVRVRDVASGQVLRMLRAPDGDELIRLAVSPDGTMLAQNTTHTSIIVWDVQRGEQLRRLETFDSVVSCLAWSPDGKWLASGSTGWTIRLWNTESWETQTIGSHSSWVSAVAWSPDGALLASSSTVGEIALWDGRTGARVGELRNAGPYAGMNISGATGITYAQRTALIALGAVDDQG